MTLSAVPTGNFDGGKNLNEGALSGSDDVILEDTLNAVITQVNTNDTAVVASKTAPTLTPGTEAADVIAIAFASPVASVEQYIAEVYDTNMEVNDAAFTMAETGGGSEIAGSGKARLIFKTSAAGAAEISVTDVAGGSGATVYVSVRPLLESADVAQVCAPVMDAITFD